ncbi:ATP-grasp domain-containing protein [Streptomyces sp. NPDC048516]|uniref:ATP-grasp domain-containing protein n=1 Tax=Streptomyces sp. NPDC048516 TaxID=3365565 RepID=UPI0037122615
MTASRHCAPAAPVLLTPAQRTSTAGLLNGAAARRGLETVTLTGPGTLRALAGRPVHWYGGPRTADRIAGPLRLGLLDPPDDWLARLPPQLTLRRVELMTHGEASRRTGPFFVKPPSDKSFPPSVVACGAQLPPATPQTPVLVSEVASFATEYRLFLLAGTLVTATRYAVHGRLDPAPLDADPYAPDVRAFAARLSALAPLPSAAAVDVGRLDGGGWAVVEANMPYFAHCYAADPAAVLEVVLRAAGPYERVQDSDRRFLRVPGGRPGALGVEGAQGAQGA